MQRLEAARQRWVQHWHGEWRGWGRGCTAQFGDRLQQLLAMAERHDAEVLEFVICHPAQQLAVDVVGVEHLGILSEADPAEPTVDVQVQSPRLLPAAALKRLNHDVRRYSKEFFVCSYQ